MTDATVTTEQTEAPGNEPSGKREGPRDEAKLNVTQAQFDKASESLANLIGKSRQAIRVIAERALAFRSMFVKLSDGLPDWKGESRQCRDAWSKVLDAAGIEGPGSPERKNFTGMLNYHVKQIAEQYIVEHGKAVTVEREVSGKDADGKAIRTTETVTVTPAEQVEARSLSAEQIAEAEAKRSAAAESRRAPVAPDKALDAVQANLSGMLDKRNPDADAARNYARSTLDVLFGKLDPASALEVLQSAMVKLAGRIAEPGFVVTEPTRITNLCVLIRATADEVVEQIDKGTAEVPAEQVEAPAA